MNEEKNAGEGRRAACNANVWLADKFLKNILLPQNENTGG